MSLRSMLCTAGVLQSEGSADLCLAAACGDVVSKRFGEVTTRLVLRLDFLGVRYT
jgi:hypothetical protein